MKGDENIFLGIEWITMITDLLELLNVGAKPDQIVLHYFCSHFCSQNCEQMLKTMIEKGVDINGVPPNSTNGDRPIHSAVFCEANIILTAGCECKRKCSRGTLWQCADGRSTYQNGS